MQAESLAKQRPFHKAPALADAKTEGEGETSRRSLTERLPTMAELIVGAAFGCATAWVSMSFKSLGLYADASRSESVLDTVYLISIVSVCVTFILAGIFDKATTRMLKSSISVWAVPLAVAVSTIGLSVSAALSGPAALAMMAASGVVSGVFSGLLLIRIGISFSLMEMRSCVIASATGTILSALLFTTSLLFGPLEATLFAASMPVLSAIFLHYGMHVLCDQNMSRSLDCAIDEEQKAADSAQDDERSPKAWSTLVARLSVCSALVGFSCEAVRTLYVQMGVVNTGSSAYALVESVGGFVATVVCVAVALILASMRSPRMAQNCYHALILLLTISSLMVLVPVVEGQKAALASHAINSASYACFGMFMWVIVSGVCNRHPSDCVRSFSFIRAGWAAGPLIGLLLGRFVFRVFGITIQSTMPVMLAAVLSILIASGFAFSETDLVLAMDLLPMRRKQHFREKCLKVADDHGLSERERQVMVLLAKGRNLPHIQEELCLSKSTISTHRQNIYRKLDIHCQQELIDLIQGG